MGFFKREATLEELEQQDEYLERKLSVQRKRTMLRELEQRGGKNHWKSFSDNGKKSGIQWGKVWAWLKSH